MGAIAFSKKPEESWVVAGWAFRQILDDVAAQYPNDAEMIKELNDAKALGGLMVYFLPPDIAARVLDAIKHVVSGILSGTIKTGLGSHPYGDKSTLQEYKVGLQQLLGVIPSTSAPPRTPGTA